MSSQANVSRKPPLNLSTSRVHFDDSEAAVTSVEYSAISADAEESKASTGIEEPEASMLLTATAHVPLAAQGGSAAQSRGTSEVVSGSSIPAPSQSSPRLRQRSSTASNTVGNPSSTGNAASATRFGYTMSAPSPRTSGRTNRGSV